MPSGAGPAEFDEMLDQVLLSFGGMMVARAPTAHGVVPVLAVLVVDMLQFLWAGGTIRLPWASPRNVLEAQVAVLQAVRESGHMLFTSRPHDKAFWTQVARYGVIARVGTVVDGPEPLSMWETRTPR